MAKALTYEQLLEKQQEGKEITTDEWLLSLLGRLSQELATDKIVAVKLK
jgi:hypothetical protein